MERVAVLGASGTIGQAIARRLVNRQAKVLLIGRNEEKIRPLSLELAAPFLLMDPREPSVLEADLIRETESNGPLTGIVNCIGSVLLKPAHLTSNEEFREVVETNLFTSFTTVRVGAKIMRAHGGSIVLFASAAAEIGIANHEAIAAAKAGIIGLARSAAATYAPNNIRVNVVSPGLIKTELTRRIWENSGNATASCSMHALGRLGEPDQVASLATWLLDPKNDWVTGQVYGIDGGLGHILPRR